MSSELPEPPVAERLDPLIYRWTQGERLCRVHHLRFGARQLNPGLGGGRFHPLRAADGAMVPTLYGSDTVDGALSETVFHNVPVRGAGRHIRRSTIRRLLLSTLIVRRDFRLAQLHGHGLRRLRISRRELIDNEADAYPATRRWAEALHQADHSIDGLIWVSRQDDGSRAVLLFGDRIASDALEAVEPSLSLRFGPGFDIVQRAAEAADIAVIV